MKQVPTVGTERPSPGLRWCVTRQSTAPPADPGNFCFPRILLSNPIPIPISKTRRRSRADITPGTVVGALPVSDYMAVELPPLPLLHPRSSTSCCLLRSSRAALSKGGGSSSAFPTTAHRGAPPTPQRPLLGLGEEHIGGGDRNTQSRGQRGHLGISEIDHERCWVATATSNHQLTTGLHECDRVSADGHQPVTHAGRF